MLNKYAKYIHFLIIFYLVWLFIIPLCFKYLTKPVLAEINSRIDSELVIESPQLRTSVLPNIKLKAKEIKLINSDKTPEMSVSNMKVSLRILPLLSGKIHLNSFQSDNIKINGTLNDKLYIAGFPIDLSQGNLNFKIKRVKIKQFKFNLKDITKSSSYNIIGENIYFKDAKNSFITHGKTKMECENNIAIANFDINLPHRKNLKKTKFNIDIDNFRLNLLTDIISKCIYDEITEIDGVISLHSNNKKMTGDFKNLKICFKDTYKNMIFPKELNIISEHRIGEDSFKIKNMVLVGDKLKSSLKGQIKNIFSATPYLDLVVNLDKSDIREGALLLPPIITPDISIPKLKQYPFYGTILGNMKIKGKLPEPDITGNIKVEDGILIRPIPNAVSGANINIDFIGKKFLLDVVVPAGGREVVYVSGDVTMYGESFANLKIKSSKSVDLNVAEFVLNPLHEILCFQIGPVPIMDINGFGNVELKISGTKKNPHIWGDFNFKNTDARFLDVNNFVLKNADGNLNFNNQQAHFINHTGTLHSQPATIDGVCTLFGDLDFDVKANNQNLSDLVEVIKTSPMLKDIALTLPNITDISGKSDFYLHLNGKLIDINDLQLNKNVIPSGFIKLLGNSLKLEDIKINKLNGIINYNKSDFDMDLKGMISSASVTTIKGVVKDNKADITIDSPKICVNELEPTKLKYLDKLYIKLKAHYKGRIDNIDIKGLNAIVEVIKNNTPQKNVKVSTGKIIIKNSTLAISNLYGTIKSNPFHMNLNISNVNLDNANKLVLNKLRANGNFYCKELDLTIINAIKKANILPYPIQKNLNNIDISGKATVLAKIKNTRLDSSVSIHNADLNYNLKNNKTNFNIPIKIKHGEINVNNNVLALDKFYCFVDDMPVILYGKIKNIYSNPNLNIRINTKLMQKPFDKYWNNNTVYPIKINGDIVTSTGLDGGVNYGVNGINGINNLRIRTDIKMEANSNIYYMGATVGDKTNPTTLNIDTTLDRNGWCKLNKLNYNKIITSQNKKNNTLPMLSVKGLLKPSGKICSFKNLTIKTENPTNADLFNIIFKKPTIKSGNFISNLVVNGDSISPKIVGTFFAKNIEMPYLNTSIKDFDINFKPDTINFTTKGTVLDNYIMVNSVMKNKLTPPFKISSADIYINDLDLNNTMSQIKQMELKGLDSAISLNTDIFSPRILNSLLISNMKVRAGNVRIKNIKASHLEALCTLNEKMIFGVDSLKFNMASGKIFGKLKYNLLNNHMHMELDSKGVNANELTIALFDLQNQIFGSLTGHIELDCNATNDKTRLTTLSGYGTFTVANGRMPKLGSLEYLLKAGSFIKGGITGLTMNGLIDILKPMRTGEFSSIDGRIRIKDGVAKTIEIRTIGKSLSLYAIGSLNLYTQIADMHIFGQLSKKATTVLGTAGNISLNTLFNKIPWVSLDNNSSLINDLNKIPGIELSNKSNRRFMVEILGDINGDNFVKSFKWIN